MTKASTVKIKWSPVSIFLVVSNKLLTFTSTNLRGELKPMHPMQWQEHTKCSNPSHPNFTKETNAMERYERKNKGNPQRTPRSGFTMFPSLRGKMDW
jgi:hypothetical protein